MANRFLRDFARRLKPFDRIALAIAFLYAAVWIVRFTGHEPPLSRPIGFFFFLSLGYLIFRVSGWVRTRLLWSLRNRLFVAYIFIAVVPVVMLLVLGGLSARILYSQLGGYLVYEDMQTRIAEVADIADTVASAATMFGSSIASGTHSTSQLPPALEAHVATLASDLPELEFDLISDGRLIKEAGAEAERAGRFAGLVQTGDNLWVVGEVRRGRVIVMARAPVTPAMLDGMAPFLGPINVFTTRPASPSDPPEAILKIGDGQYRTSERIDTRLRQPAQAAAWYDFEFDGLSKLDSMREDTVAHTLTPSPVFVHYSARPVAVSRHLFTSLGDLGSMYVELFLVVLLIFMVLEIGSAVTGFVLTRTITRSVRDLYEATQYARAGDFSHRVRIERADQLGALGESFNAMSSSIDTLIEEQRIRQRLENEVSIAHEVQSQLFPRNVPVIQGIELAAFCKPARGVSGDYYDFLPLGPTRLAIALADISGKGISAALLMASVQAALRSQLLLDPGANSSAAEVVSRINRHLYLNTSEDRFATFFFAIYDSSTRILRYTNAGHCPPMCLLGDKVQRLETGGTVVGVFEDTLYEEGVVEVPPGSILVVYSDGLIEPENVYGEEFGITRLEDVAIRHQQSSTDSMVSALLLSAEEWAGTAEQADDMTVIVARLGDHTR